MRNQRSGSSRSRRLVAVLGLLVLAMVVYVGVTVTQVWRAAARDGAQPAEAIVVLGAAQYDGQPSAALRGRLDHAADLYDRRLAPLIVVTGGRREGDRFTEAAAGARYLQQRGVPGGAIERETTGASSYSSLAATAAVLRAQGIQRVLLVSDPFHNYRIQAIAREVGLDGSASASTTSPYAGRSKLRQVSREVAAVAVGRLIGYRRLETLGWRLASLQG